MTQKSIKNKESTKNHQQDWGALKPMPYAQSFLSIFKKNWIPNSRAKPSPIFCGTWSTGVEKRGDLPGELPPQQKCSELHVGKCSLVSDIFWYSKPPENEQKPTNKPQIPFRFYCLLQKGIPIAASGLYSSKNETRGRISSLIKPKQPYFFFNLLKHAHMNSLSWKTLRPLEVFFQCSLGCTSLR